MGCAPQAANSARCSSSPTNQEISRAVGIVPALQRDTAKSPFAYNDFLTLWKDADPDVPILKEAKAEYAKLQ